jgi:glycosyltransferase involved in cell wall biosynthesis
MFSGYFPPEYSGAALQAIALAKQLTAMGHQVEFVTQRWPGLPAEDVVHGFPVTRLQGGHGTKHRELRLWWNLYRFLRCRRGEFDFLHSHSAYYKDSIVGPLARHFGLKSLAKASLHDNDLHDLGRSLAGRIHLAMLRRIDACIAISRDLEREFIAGGVSKDNVHYLPNSVDTNRFRPTSGEEKRHLRRLLGLPEDRKIVLYVGVFDERKNITWLVEKWCQSQAFATGSFLLAVGPKSRDDPDGVLKSELVTLVSRHRSFARIAEPVTCIEDFYRAADVFVLPSRGEGLPNAVLEAMACGLPCVAADVSGVRELVDDGRTGLLFQIDDEASLQAALQNLDDEKQAVFGRAARTKVEERFDIGRLGEAYQSLYESLASES